MEAIYEVNGQLDLVITLEDTQAVEKSGRVYLDDFCNKYDIPLLKSQHVNNQEVIDVLREREIDWLFIIGWSQIANSDLLAAPQQGVLGMHPTLLPIGRGRAAIPWAILKGLDKTGVTMFKLDAGVDTGPIVEQVEIPLTENEYAGNLYKKVNAAHVELMQKSFPMLNEGILAFRVQDESQATVWEGRTPADGEIDLQGSVYDAERLVRATSRPYPGAFTEIDGKKVVIWKASMVPCGKGPLIQFHDGSLELLDFEEVS